MESARIEIRPPKLERIKVAIEGTNTLIVHNFGEKSRRQIRDKQGGKAGASKKKTIREPEKEFQSSRYLFINEDGEEVDGFPSISLKKGMVDAGYRYMGLAKADLRGDLHVDGEFVQILGRDLAESRDWPDMREDVVRLAGVGQPADLRYRAEYEPWSMMVSVTFKPDRVSSEQIVNMLYHMGFSGGLGELRPQKSGDDHGTFKIVDAFDATEELLAEQEAQAQAGQ